VASEIGGHTREGTAVLLITELRRALFANPAGFREFVRAGVRLALPARSRPRDDLVDALVSSCLMTLLDLRNAEAAVRVLAREDALSAGEAIEALCCWTVRREQARIRAAERGGGGMRERRR
jgi:hypothetical protein